MEHCNESYELLTLSSNESSDEFKSLLKKKKLRRKSRSRTQESKSSPQSTNGCCFKLYMSILCLYFIGITVCVFALTWATVQLRIEMQSLRNNVDKVSAGNEGIPESIQKCHSLTKQLDKNQTKVINQLQRVAQRLTNFSNMISGIQADLSKVEKKLDEPPPQLNVPVSFQSLTTNIASFRGQIDELQCKAAGIIDEQAQLKTFIDSVKANVTLLYKNLHDIRKHSAVTNTSSSQINKEDMVNFVLGKIRPDIYAVNTTLLSKVKWLSDDMIKAQKVISNLTDESALLKSYFLTIRNELTELRNGIKDHNSKWNELLGETKILHSNLTKVMTSCSQCKYWHNEELMKDISSIASATEMSNSTYN